MRATIVIFLAGVLMAFAPGAQAMSTNDARAVAKYLVTPIAKMADARATYRVRMRSPERAMVRARLRGRIDMQLRLSVEERPDVWRVNLESMRVL